MHIVVCVKQVPDTWSEKKLNADDRTLDRDSTDPVMNEMDEYALEEALRLQENHGGEVTVLSMGPATTADTLRKALQMGVDRAVHVLDDALHGSDALSTSLVLARAVERLQADLVVMGSETSDARMGVVPAMLAERLGWPQLTFAMEVTVGDETVRIKRVADDGHYVIEGPRPAVVSVVEKINEPRYPSFKGIMAAKKKPLDTWMLADLAIEPGAVGMAGASTVVAEFEQAPPRSAGTIIHDEGDGAARIVEFLAAKKFI